MRIKPRPTPMFPVSHAPRRSTVSASEAWQAASGLESGEISDVSLRAAFKRIDLNGNGPTPNPHPNPQPNTNPNPSPHRSPHPKPKPDHNPHPRPHAQPQPQPHRHHQLNPSRYYPRAGNGVIEQHELKAALLSSGQIEGDEATMQTVDNMIEWACTKAPNGDIDFEEYARIMRVKLDLAKQAPGGVFIGRVLIGC